MKVGIIGGSGLYEIEGFQLIEEIEIETTFGSPSGSYRKFVYNDVEFYFLNRHGKDHKIPPHSVNYRANILGFKQLGVDRIFSFTAVGGIRKYRPGEVVIPHNAIDFTNGRASTFYDFDEIYHIDFTEPFCPELRNVLMKAAEKGGVDYRKQGVYVCTNGPRLETASEIKMFEKMDADLVGMTLFPECTLAREKEICYANVSVITNYAAGTVNQKLTTEEVVNTMMESQEKIKNIVKGIAASLKEERICFCKDALQGTKISK